MPRILQPPTSNESRLRLSEGQDVSPSNSHSLASSQEDMDTTSDAFYMYVFKVKLCTKPSVHSWSNCPYAHVGETALRRDPSLYSYSSMMCPQKRLGIPCCNGDSCEFAHNVFESWLHPERYKTKLCRDGKRCSRSVCFFAHGPADVRVGKPDGQPVADTSRVAERRQAESASLLNAMSTSIQGAVSLADVFMARSESEVSNAPRFLGLQSSPGQFSLDSPQNTAFCMAPQSIGLSLMPQEMTPLIGSNAALAHTGQVASLGNWGLHPLVQNGQYLEPCPPVLNLSDLVSSALVLDMLRLADLNGTGIQMGSR